MRIYRYVIDHDVGFSPNPFHGSCTLANCKPVIRKNAALGDYILGFGAANSKIQYRLIYWMVVERILTFDEYWQAPEFNIKKPVINGSHLKFHGDNIYHTNEAGHIIQEPSFHSLEDGSPNLKNIQRDTGLTNRIMITKTFGYYGKNALFVPTNLMDIIAKGRGHRTKISDELKDAVTSWLMNHTPRGYRDEPSSWHKIK